MGLCKRYHESTCGAITGILCAILVEGRLGSYRLILTSLFTVPMPPTLYGLSLEHIGRTYELMASGVRFTNCYNMGGWSGAVSTASRSQLVTGQFLWKTFAAKNKDKYQTLFENRDFWPQVMHDAGYKTYQTGKWHVSHYEPHELFDFTELVRPVVRVCFRKE